MARWGRLDVLHNNVGISVTGGDAAVTEITTEAFDLVMAVNLRGTVMACKHALPHMRRQGSGAIVKAGARLIDQGREIAASVLEVAAVDVSFEDGAFRVTGTDLIISLADVAKRAAAGDGADSGGGAGRPEAGRAVHDRVRVRPGSDRRRLGSRG